MDDQTEVIERADRPTFEEWAHHVHARQSVESTAETIELVRADRASR